jgi:pheromone shutdown protein TraB
LRVVLRTSSLAVAALVETKEDVVLVVGLGHAPILDQSPDRRSSAREINQAIAR